MKKLMTIVAMAVVLALGSVEGGQVMAQAVNLVVNGDFEEPDIPAGSWTNLASIPGWTQFTGFGGIEVQDHVAGSPFSGNQFVELDSDATTGIFQDVPTQPDCVYELSFAFSPRPGTSAAENILRVTWDGQEVVTVSADGLGLPDTDWTVHTFSVAGGSGSTSTRLEFEDRGPSNSFGTYIDAVSVVESCGIEVQIDIKPGSFPNSINTKSKGTIPVAILSTADFDATTQVDRTSLTFGRTGDEASLIFCTRSDEDVNGDGLLDIVCHFRTSLTGFQVGDTEGILKGMTVGGVPIEGRDSVRIVK